MGAGANYDVFSRHLEWMKENGLLVGEDAPDGHERIRLTPEGREAYRRIAEWINDVVLRRATP